MKRLLPVALVIFATPLAFPQAAAEYGNLAAGSTSGTAKSAGALGKSVQSALSGQAGSSAPAQGTKSSNTAKSPTAAKKPVARSTTAKPAASSNPKAIIETSAGKLTCELFPDKAPIGVQNFIGLANGTKDWTNPVTHAKKHGTPLYDGTIFHRVIPEFMIQGGDPKGDGTGDPGYSFKNETSTSLKFDRPGRLAYANAGPDTNGSQFFITEVPYPSLNGGYTIFGQCDPASVELVKRMARLPRNANDRPNNPPRITHISIVQPGAATPKAPAKPATKKPTTTKPKTAAAPKSQQ